MPNVRDNNILDISVSRTFCYGGRHVQIWCVDMQALSTVFFIRSFLKERGSSDPCGNQVSSTRYYLGKASVSFHSERFCGPLDVDIWANLAHFFRHICCGCPGALVMRHTSTPWRRGEEVGSYLLPAACGALGGSFCRDITYHKRSLEQKIFLCVKHMFGFI